MRLYSLQTFRSLSEILFTWTGREVCLASCFIACRLTSSVMSIFNFLSSFVFYCFEQHYNGDISRIESTILIGFSPKYSSKYGAYIAIKNWIFILFEFRLIGLIASHILYTYKCHSSYPLGQGRRSRGGRGGHVPPISWRAGDTISNVPPTFVKRPIRCYYF